MLSFQKKNHCQFTYLPKNCPLLGTRVYGRGVNNMDASSYSSSWHSPPPHSIPSSDSPVSFSFASSSSGSDSSSSSSDDDGVFFFLIGGTKAQRTHVKHLLNHAHTISGQVDPILVNEDIYHSICAAATAVSSLVCHVSNCNNSQIDNLDEMIMRKLYRYETRYGCAALAVIIHLHSWRVSTATRIQVKALQSTSLPLLTVIVDLPPTESIPQTPPIALTSSASSPSTTYPRTIPCHPSRWLDQRFAKHYSANSAPYTNRDVLTQIGNVKSLITVLPPPNALDEALSSDRGDDGIVLGDELLDGAHEEGGDDDDEMVALDTSNGDMQDYRYFTTSNANKERERIMCLLKFYNSILTLFE